MDKNYNLSDIGNALWAVIDNPVAKIIRSGAIGTIDILNPAAGVVAGVGDTLLGEYNNYYNPRKLEACFRLAFSC